MYISAKCRQRRTEKEIVYKIGKFFASLGYTVFTHVQFLSTEIDLVGVKLNGQKYTVIIVEVKLRPREKLIKQILARRATAHKVYAGLPAEYYEWAVRKIPQWCGIVTVEGQDYSKIVIRRRAQLINSSDSPIYFAKILLNEGKFMCERVILPKSNEHISPDKVLTVLRTFLSSLPSTSGSSSSSSLDFSSTSSSGYVPVRVLSFIFSLPARNKLILPAARSQLLRS